MSLNGGDLLEIQTILLEIGVEKDFEIWWLKTTDKPLFTVVARGPLKDVVFDLLMALQREGRLGDFLAAVIPDRPLSLLLKDFRIRHFKEDLSSEGAPKEANVAVVEKTSLKVVEPKSQDSPDLDTSQGPGPVKTVVTPPTTPEAVHVDLQL